MGLTKTATVELAQRVMHRSRDFAASKWGALLASQLAVLFLCRGLLFGSGGYELYVDPALPASGSLLRGICENSLSLWSSANLGHRILYPAEYVVCGPIVAGLNIGIPAWAISRLLPVVALLVAAAGVVALLAHLRPPARTPSTNGLRLQEATAAFIAAVIYAGSAFSFTELVTGHFLYLVGLAAVPWAAWVILTRRRSLGAILVAGLILGVAYGQIQFVVLAPVSLLLLACVAGSTRAAWRSIGAACVGLVPHLPWILPSIAYRPEINIGSYLIPGTDQGFSISPPNSIRLVGYVTPFVETTVQQWGIVWRPLSFLVVGLAIVGLFSLSLKRAAILVGSLALVIYYQWGAYAPGYGLWSGLVPWPLHGLFRERYSLAFVTLIVITALVYLAFLYLFPLWRWGALVAFAIALVGAVGAFADGHLGPYGLVREDFATSQYLTGFIQNHGGGPVLTIPFGSIVRKQNWPYFGRNPFNLGGPQPVLDTEGDPAAPALPTVKALANALSGSSFADQARAREDIALLGIRYVVDFKNLIGDTNVDRNVVRTNLQALGGRLVWQNADAALWQMSGVPPDELKAGKSLFLSFGGGHPGVAANSAEWGARVVITDGVAPAVLAGIANDPNAVVHLNEREVSTAVVGTRLLVTEPVMVVKGRSLEPRLALYEGVVNGPDTVSFSDGTVVSKNADAVTVIGPANKVFSAKLDAQITMGDLIPAARAVQDTKNSQGRTLIQAGIAAVLTKSDFGPAVAVTAGADEAGLPISLPVRKGARYALSVETSDVAGPQARLAVLVNGTDVLERELPMSSNWHPTALSFTVPADARAIYLYVYLPGSSTGQTSKILVRNLRGSVTEVISQRPFPLNLVELRQAPNLTAPAIAPGSDLVISQEQPSLSWAFSREGADRWWTIRGAAVELVKLRADGFRNIWLIHGPLPGNASLTYLPNALFQVLLAVVWLLLAAATAAVFWIYHWHASRRTALVLLTSRFASDKDEERDRVEGRVTQPTGSSRDEIR